MDPITTLIAARVGMNLLGNITGGLNKVGQPAAAPTAGTPQADPLAFQKMLQQVAASPAVQNAARIESAGIHGMDDVPLKMGDYASRIVQDPAVQEFLRGESQAADIKFLGNGVVTVQTSDGRSQTIRLENPDSRSAALQAEEVTRALRNSGALPSTPSQSIGVNPSLFTLRYRIGDGAAQLTA